MRAVLVLLAMLVIISPVSAEVPSFACARGPTDIERLICNNPRLAVTDRRLAEAYRDALAARRGRERVHLRRAQRAFLAGRDTCLYRRDRVGCLNRLMEARIAALNDRR